MRYICEDCGEPCDLIKMDVGIGKTYAYGSATNDICLIEVSKCCEANVEIVEDECETIKGVDYGFFDSTRRLIAEREKSL